ncbi:hypothetical protein [Halobacillus naozhouensis]|uniref:DUF3953 domain-containing protein n=1 Tax=Halobacillus naozhouensis TaxID=554880 RepID=A0ABY8IWP4_9BACI|nr:hypothetical protein [Halobacillus naozhouensis]WFT73629.1 hypothetical protein P9989_14785 [Halobacillus naozhouensis]
MLPAWQNRKGTLLILDISLTVAMFLTIFINFFINFLLAEIILYLLGGIVLIRAIEDFSKNKKLYALLGCVIAIFIFITTFYKI